MAGQSGKDGKVLAGATQLAEITKWTFNPKSNNPAWASSDSAGYKKRVAGVKDGGGSIEGKFDSSSKFYTLVAEGDEVTLKLYLDATRYYSVPAIIDDYSLTVDMDTGDVVGWSANFSTNGAWTEPA